MQALPYFFKSLSLLFPYFLADGHLKAWHNDLGYVIMNLVMGLKFIIAGSIK